MVTTPNTDRFKLDIAARFNVKKIDDGSPCRRIAGSWTYSQHAWGNALDIFPISKAEGDRIYAWYRDNRNVRTALWWRKDHYDHIHLDFWPYGIYTPPCARGRLQVKHFNGVINQSWTPDFPMYPPPPLPTPIEEEQVKEGDKGLHVAYWQRALHALNAYQDSPGWQPPVVGEIGTFDKPTVTAVKKFQARPGVALYQTGIIDLSTASAIIERTNYLALHKHNKPPHDNTLADLEAVALGEQVR